MGIDQYFNGMGKAAANMLMVFSTFSTLSSVFWVHCYYTERSLVLLHETIVYENGNFVIKKKKRGRTSIRSSVTT